jgi:hypothetical protein
MARTALRRISDDFPVKAIAFMLVVLASITWPIRLAPLTTAASEPDTSTFKVVLTSDAGEPISADIQREIEVDRVPIAVVYRIISTSTPLTGFEWSVTQADPGPFYTFAVTQIQTYDDGRTSMMECSSNRPHFEILIQGIDESGMIFKGTDEVHVALSTGTSIRLGTPDSLLADCSQAFAGQQSLEYVTQNRVAVQQDTGGWFFTPEWPGNYRFLIRQSDRLDVVEAYVTMRTDRRLEMRGAFVADYYGTHWIPNKVNIDQEIILATTDLAKDLGANTFCVVNFWKVMQWYPIPLFCSTEGGPSISMTMLNAIGDACEALGLDLYLHLGNFTPWPYHNDEEDAKYWDPSSNDAEWYRRYFSEVERFALYNLRGALDAGIDLFTAQARSGNMYIGSNFEQYGLNQQCEQLIENIRAVYDGAYGWCAPYPDRNNAFLNDCDFVHLFLNWRDQFRAGSFRNDSKPTPSEVREAALDYLSRYEGQLPAGIDVFVNVSALSADGQVSIRGEAENTPVDYQEQVAFLEGFFEAVHETPWITGAAVWNLFWFDWSPELAEIMGDFTYNSIRGKPAEEVVRLWFDTLGD